MPEHAPPSTVDLSAYKLYLGVSLHETDELSEARASVCKALGLVQRREAHVTVAYVGQVTEGELAALARELAPLLDDELASFHLKGTGAAWEELGQAPRLLLPTLYGQAQAHACVAWWSIDITPPLSRLRNAATTLLADLGRPVAANEPYRPHVTLGSRGGAGIADEDFDVFVLEKAATLPELSAPARVLAARAHFTASKLLPASALCLRTF